MRRVSSGNLAALRMHWRIDDRAFSVTAPRAWNRLPAEPKLLQLTTTFRHQLKTFLFQLEYWLMIVFFVMCRESWSSSSGSNTNATVTVELIPDGVPSLILSSCRLSFSVLLRSVLWHCWIDTKKSIWTVKIEWWDVGVVVCLERGADCLHVVQPMPLPFQTQSFLASLISITGTGLSSFSWKRPLNCLFWAVAWYKRCCGSGRIDWFVDW